ncbi:MAG TPA: ABC transporter substrate-binding protein [Dehalococcoidia bacterium]|nr:ABC transporter substrate-binding protein [Dehalococcoidia bacterium]
MLTKRITRRRAIVGLGAVGAGALVAACSSGSSSGGGSGSTDTRKQSSGPPKKGGTLRFSFSGDPTGLDPSTSRGGNDHHWLYSIFENLVNSDPTFQVAKGISDKWEVIDDLTISFHVPAGGFVYHDGTPYTSQDVKFMIDRHLDPATKSFAAGSLGSVDKVEIVDPTHAVFKLKAVTASIFAILGDRAGMLMSPAAIEKYGADFTNKPVGSGPLKLDSWQLDSSQKLSRFAQYRVSGYPYMDGVNVDIVPNSSVQYANLKSGNSDLIFIAPKDIDAARKDTDIQMVQWASTGYTQVNLNISQPPLTDIRVRQAMTYSLNRKAILEGIYFGDGELANGPLTKATWAYNQNLKPIEEDLKKATDLVNASGIRGKPFDLLITADETNTPLSEMLKAQWARVGIEVNIVVTTPQQATIDFRDQKYPFFLTGFSGRADPDLTIYDNFHSKGAFNRASFNRSYTPEESQRTLDVKIEKARQIYDQAQRKVLYDDIQKQIVENAHGIFFTHRTNRVGLSKRVRGFTPYGDGKLRMHEMWLES